MKQLILLIMVTFLSACAHTNGHQQDIGARVNSALAFDPLEERQVESATPVSSETLNALMGFDYELDDGNSRFDINAIDVPARVFFNSLVAGTGENMVLPSDLEGSISLSLNSVTIEEALNAISDVYGYDFERNDYGYRLIANELQTRVFEVNYLAIQREGSSRSQVHSGEISQKQLNNSDQNSDRRYDADGNVTIKTANQSDFWGELKASLDNIIGGKPGRKVSVSPQSSIVVVTANTQEIRQIRQVLEVMEANVSRQVILEAKILEVTLSEGFQSGINWSGLALNNSGNGFSANQIGGGSTNGVNANTRGNSGQVSPSGINFPGLDNVAAFGGVFNLAFQGNDFGGFIELLKQQGDVQVLSSPRVSTLNNQKAVIKVGTDNFFVTDISTTTTSSSGSTTTSPSVSLTPFFSGIALDVTPQVSANNIVTLHVHPTISEVSETNKLLPLGSSSREVPLASSNVRESDSVIRAQSGQVVVIGGLMQTITDNQKLGIPGLGDAPLIGGAFSQRKNLSRKRELVILLRPVVVENGEWDQVPQSLGMQGW